MKFQPYPCTIWRGNVVYIIDTLDDLEDLVDPDVFSILMNWEKNMKRNISDSYDEGYESGFIDGQKRGVST